MSLTVNGVLFHRIFLSSLEYSILTKTDHPNLTSSIQCGGLCMANGRPSFQFADEICACLETRAVLLGPLNFTHGEERVYIKPIKQGMATVFQTCFP